MDSSFCNILDLPDEILIQIFSHFNARKRVVLANTCTRFYSLVFGDKDLLRDLDFSENGCLTTATDIQEYFSTEDACKLVRKINIQNVRCMKAGDMLNNSIGKAINLTDMNIFGTKFKDIKQLGEFLETFIHLKRLSIDWPQPEKNSSDVCSTVLEEPFSRLTYLSIVGVVHENDFLNAVKLCQELEELRMVTTPTSHTRNILLNKEPDKLRKLKIIQYRGWESSWTLKEDLMDLVQDPAEWTDFYLENHDTAGYLEKNVEVCDELSKLKFMLSEEKYLCQFDSYNEEIGWPVMSQCLLSEVINITQEGRPEEFCCLDEFEVMRPHPCLLKIDEAKRLLKDPRYQISYLYFMHSIERYCDAHLVTSAFPTLTKLVLCRISKRKYPRTPRNFWRRLSEGDTGAPLEYNDLDNQDSSFKILVDDSPQLRDLTINSKFISDEEEASKWWDVDALYLISHWSNLTAIRLKNIPITDGKFLIDIGKECRKLEEVQLFSLGPKHHCCYTNDLLKMLQHCTNLKKFSICQRAIGNMSQLFDSLSNNSKLGRVRLMSKTDEYDSLELISSVEQLLHRCPDLTKFIFMVQSAFNRVKEELKPALVRIIDQLNRPDFQFYGPESFGPNRYFEDAPTSFFPSPSDDRQFTYY